MNTFGSHLYINILLCVKKKPAHVTELTGKYRGATGMYYLPTGKSHVPVMVFSMWEHFLAHSGWNMCKYW